MALQALLRGEAAEELGALATFRTDCADLRKYSVLNYIAVIKSCKKRNRQLAAGLAPVPVPPLHAVQLLSQQYWCVLPTHEVPSSPAAAGVPPPPLTPCSSAPTA